jgi:hypothetical protein
LGGSSLHKSGGEAYEHEASNAVAIDNLTQVDIQLYRAGVLRFVREMQKVELETGAQVLCSSRIGILKRESGYISGLWDEVSRIVPHANNEG